MYEKKLLRFIFELGALIFLITFIPACGDNKKKEDSSEGNKKMLVIMVTDQAGLGDHGFNDSGWAGILKASGKFKLNARCIQSMEQSDYIPNLVIAAKEADIIVAMGFLMLDAVKEVAPRYPDKAFIFIDGKIEAANVASYDFKGEEASFIAGYIAANVSRTGKLGVINGMDIPPVLAYEYGFRAGVEAAGMKFDRNLNVIRLTVGDFNNPVKGKSLARNLLSRDCDIIIQLAGNSGIGAIELFKQSNPPAFLISSDIDIEDEIPGKVLTCVMKRFDVAVYNAISQRVKGDFKTGYYYIGLKENAVGITDMLHTKRFVQSAVLEDIDELKRKIIEGRLIIPRTEEQLRSKYFDDSLMQVLKGLSLK